MKTPHHSSKPTGNHAGKPNHHKLPQRPSHQPPSWEELLGRR